MSPTMRLITSVCSSPSSLRRGGKGLRVQVAKGGCSGLQYEMSLDERHEGDAVVRAR